MQQGQGNFLLQTKWVLQALLGGADVDKIQRHWPGYRLVVEPGKFVFEHATTETDQKPCAPDGVENEKPAVSKDANSHASDELEEALAAAMAAASASKTVAAPETLAPVE